MKPIWLILTSLGSAFVATLCCLPALLFLLFGTSFSFLSWTQGLYEYRTLFSVLALVSFVLCGIFIFYKPKSCALGVGRKKWLFIYIISGAIVLCLLFYPEILGKFYA
ncbi:aryl sulfotransferase [Campylobacter curvus]|uniref:aryl sulfotransferase n=1 Tax=Campylobacter curvus TaxID=200 RepID=UPI0014700465|nr:aryl sulfotransferase [Campylobacter curvus]